MQYLFFSVWLTSLCMTVSRSIYKSNFIPFYGRVIFHGIYMCHVFFIRSSIDGPLVCFHVLAIANSAAVNTGVYVSFWIMFFSGICLGVGLLGHMVVLFSVLMRIKKAKWDGVSKIHPCVYPICLSYGVSKICPWQILTLWGI